MRKNLVLSKHSMGTLILQRISYSHIMGKNTRWRILKDTQRSSFRPYRYKVWTKNKQIPLDRRIVCWQIWNLMYSRHEHLHKRLLYPEHGGQDGAWRRCAVYMTSNSTINFINSSRVKKENNYLWPVLHVFSVSLI